MDTQTPQPIKFQKEFTSRLEAYIQENKEPTIEEFAKLIGVTSNTLGQWANKIKKDENGNPTQELARPQFHKLINTLPLNIECQACKPEPNKFISINDKGECIVCGKLVDKPKHAGGRPPLYTSVEELEAKIEEYFDYCDNRAIKVVNKDYKEYMISSPAPYTMSGLARRLGMDRKTLLNYSKNEEFFPTIREAKMRVQEDVENRMMETKNEKGAMFSLKNNFGWKDEQNIDHTTKGKEMPTPIMSGELHVPTNDSN